MIKRFEEFQLTIRESFNVLGSGGVKKTEATEEQTTYAGSGEGVDPNDPSGNNTSSTSTNPNP